MKIMQGHGDNARRLVVSLCDYSGNWPQPWNKAGHTVVCFDLKHGDDVTDVVAVDNAVWRMLESLGPDSYVDCLLAAPPCTTFTNSGARWWPRHDASGETAQCLAVFDACVELIKRLCPRVWALENPAGRLPKLRPEWGKPSWYFHPHQYAGYCLSEQDRDAQRYTKLTGIWTNGRKPMMSSYTPVMIEKKRKDGTVVRGSWMWANLGGKSERTKALRSNTPVGFAKAFYADNRP
jgi:hypothetical protein